MISVNSEVRLPVFYPVKFSGSKIYGYVMPRRDFADIPEHCSFSKDELKCKILIYIFLVLLCNNIRMSEYCLNFASKNNFFFITIPVQRFYAKMVFRNK